MEKAAKANAISVKSVSHEALKYLYQYDWIGNVRELENVIERAVILCDGDDVGPQDLPEELFQQRLPGITREVSGQSRTTSDLAGDGELLPYLGLNQRQAKAFKPGDHSRIVRMDVPVFAHFVATGGLRNGIACLNNAASASYCNPKRKRGMQWVR